MEELYGARKWVAVRGAPVLSLDISQPLSVFTNLEALQTLSFRGFYGGVIMLA